MLFDDVPIPSAWTSRQIEARQLQISWPILRSIWLIAASCAPGSQLAG